jgi:hypothetical protein
MSPVPLVPKVWSRGDDLGHDVGVERLLHLERTL